MNSLSPVKDSLSESKIVSYPYGINRVSDSLWNANFCCACPSQITFFFWSPLLVCSIITIEPNSFPQVIEYLSKKGYNRTEAMLRLESASQDVEGKTVPVRVEETGGLKYGKAFGRYLSTDDRFR